MKNLNVFFLVIAFLSISSCTDSSKNKDSNNQFVISANVAGPSDSTVMYLKDLEKDEIIDTTYIINSEFGFTGSVEHPKLFEIGNTFKLNARRYYEWIWVENSNITLEGDFGSLIVAGSRTHDKRAELLKLIDPVFWEMVSLEDKKDKTEEDKIELRELKEKRKQIRINFFKENPNSYVTAREMRHDCIFNYLTVTEIQELYNILSPELKQSTYGQGIKIFLDLPVLPEIGDKYVDFALPNPKGDTLRLSDYEGKYALIYFWSSYTSPSCRPHSELLRLYKTYQPFGFEIIGVSEDKNRDKWISTIKRDSVIWANVSNLRGRFNEASRIYRINQYPTLILIDTDGTIIFRDWQIENLENKLKEIFIFDQKI
jgi:peroxiredoxin